MGKLITGDELRKFATPGDVHVDPLLTDFAVNYKNVGFVGDACFPVIPVNKRSAKYAVFEASRRNLRVQNTLRAPRTAAKTVEYEVDLTNSYAAEEYSLASGVDDQERDNADAPIDPDQRAARIALEGLLLDREDRIGTKVRLAANYTASHVVALAGGNQWSDAVNSSPKVDVDAGRDLIVQHTGVLPNTLLLPWLVVQKLKLNNKITDAFKYTATQGAVINLEQLKAYFEIDNIVVAGALKNTANEGAAAVIARIWGKDVWMGYVDPNSSPQDGISFGKTFRWKQNGQPRLTRSYYEPKARTTWTEVTEANDEKITAKDCGYLIQTAIA
jgi:hypothetical protein